MLTELDKERLRTLTVEHILDVRALYLRTTSANPLKHWELLQARVRAAAKTTSSVEEWGTELARAMRLETPSSDSSRSLRALADFVRERRAAREFLQLIDDEWGYVMALARGLAEERKESRNVRDQSV